MNKGKTRLVEIVNRKLYAEALEKDEIDEVRRIVKQMLKDLWRVLYSKPGFWASN